MDNLGYLFAAFGVIWLVVFGYVLVLIRRQGRIRKDIVRLEDTLSGEDGK